MLGTNVVRSLQDCVLWNPLKQRTSTFRLVATHRVIAHYHKVDLTSTLLDAHTIQNVPHHSRCWLALKINDFRPLRRSRRRWCKHTLNKAALRCAYEHGGKRKRKCPSKVFWREFPSDTHSYYPPAPNSLFVFFFLYFEHCEQWSCAACYSIFSLCVHVLRLCPVLTAVYRLSILPHKLYFGKLCNPVCVLFQKADRVFGAKTI